MSKVAIVTDSTAYIPRDLLEQYQIHMLPQVLIWGEQTLEDGVDISSMEFFTRLKTAKVLPTTSQVTPASFLKIFTKLVEQDYSILNILISEKLSGTIASAVQARESFPSAQIEIIDSYTTAMALGFQAITVARVAMEGASLSECVQLAEKARQHTGVIFAVDTLEFLHRGGRIGGANRFLGTALNIKPILEVTGGRVDAVERVRTRKKSLSRVVELVEERVAGRTPLRIATLHANAPEEARQVLELVTERLHPIESVFSEVSPVVANHAGPGTCGIAFMAGM
jgi:DegV family protein with EDD domain